MVVYSITYVHILLVGGLVLLYVRAICLYITDRYYMPLSGKSVKQ